MSSGDWVLPADELASKFTPRTKAIVINTPNNPLGKVRSEIALRAVCRNSAESSFYFFRLGTLTSLQVYEREELQVIADLCIKHDVLCFSDEVYEWLTYDGAKHVKMGEGKYCKRNRNTC